MRCEESKKNIYLDTELINKNIPIYVNSLTPLANRIKNLDKYTKKICILRGCPQSFKIQNETEEGGWC